MGYIKQKQLPTGYQASYCRPIASPNLRLDAGVVELQIAWYKDVEARFTGAQPASYETVNVRLTRDQTARIAQVLYEALRELPEFADAQVRDPDPERQREEGTHDAWSTNPIGTGPEGTV